MVEYRSDEKLDTIQAELDATTDIDEREAIRKRWQAEHAKPLDPFLPENLTNLSILSHPLPIPDLTMDQLFVLFDTAAKNMGRNGFSTLEKAQEQAKDSRDQSGLASYHVNAIRNYEAIKQELRNCMEDYGILDPL